MSTNFRNQSGSYVREKEILEPEGGCEERIINKSQSGRQISEANFSLRKCQSVDGGAKKVKSRNVRRLRTRNLRVPEVPEKIVDIVNILQHENFLQVVDQFFKPTAKTQPQKKQSRKRNVNRTNESKSRVPVSVDFDNNTL